MAELLYDQIPSLDLTDFTSGDPQRKQKFVEALGAAYNSIGFVAIRNHYLTDELSAKLYESIKNTYTCRTSVVLKTHCLQNFQLFLT